VVAEEGYRLSHICRIYDIAFAPALKTKSEDHKFRPNQVGPTSSEIPEAVLLSGEFVKDDRAQGCA